MSEKLSHWLEKDEQDLKETVVETMLDTLSKKQFVTPAEGALFMNEYNSNFNFEYKQSEPEQDVWMHGGYIQPWGIRVAFKGPNRLKVEDAARVHEVVDEEIQNFIDNEMSFGSEEPKEYTSIKLKIGKPGWRQRAYEEYQGYPVDYHRGIANASKSEMQAFAERLNARLNGIAPLHRAPVAYANYIPPPMEPAYILHSQPVPPEVTIFNISNPSMMVAPPTTTMDANDPSRNFSLDEDDY